MAWLTLKQASERGPSRATWERRILSGRVASFLKDGRRFVWIPEEEATLEIVHEGVQDVRRELRKILDQLRGLQSAAAEVQQVLPDPTPIPRPRAA